MKKVLLTIAVLVGMAVGAMTLSAFTTLKQDAKAKSSLIQMNHDDVWKVYRENVPYCDGDTDRCMGYGYVLINTETKQLAFAFGASKRDNEKYHLSEYTEKKGYNYRFWYGNPGSYYYVKI